MLGFCQIDHRPKCYIFIKIRISEKHCGKNGVLVNSASLGTRLPMFFALCRVHSKVFDVCHSHGPTLAATYSKSIAKCRWNDEAVSQICGTEIAEMWTRDVDTFSIDHSFLFPTVKVSLEISIWKLPKTRETCQPHHVGIIWIEQP